MIDADRGVAPTTIIYLQDDLPIPPDAVKPLSELCPKATLTCLYDRDLMAEFANLPKFLPAIARRNLRLPVQGRGATPRAWRPPELAGARFSTGYIYHPGFFSAKVLAGMCGHVVMRESGMNNYTSLPVSPLKAVLRALNGLPPRRQIWGEERWIDAIEVEDPGALPPSVRGKARAMRFTEVLQSVHPSLPRALVRLLAPGVSDIVVPPRSALLLTQPIDELLLCSTEDKLNLYGHLAQGLASRGYTIYVKNHPREARYALPGTESIEQAFPIEAWPLVQTGKFDLAVAIHSASLAQSEPDFACKTLQLYDNLSIDHPTLRGWCDDLDRRLDRLCPSGRT